MLLLPAPSSEGQSLHQVAPTRLTFVLALKAERGADWGVTGDPATRAADVLAWGVAARGRPGAAPNLHQYAQHQATAHCGEVSTACITAYHSFQCMQLDPILCSGTMCKHQHAQMGLQLLLLAPLKAIQEGNTDSMMAQ